MSLVGDSTRSIISSSLWLLSAIVLLVVVVSTVPAASGAAHELPRLWPGVAIALMTIGGLCVLGKQIARHRSSFHPELESKKPSDEDSDRDHRVQQPLVHLYIVVFVIFYIVVVEYVGFIVATSVLFFSIATIMRAKKLLRVALLAGVFGLATAYLFGELLSVALPRGASFLADLSRIIY